MVYALIIECSDACPSMDVMCAHAHVSIFYCMFIVFSIGLSVSYEMFKSLRYDMKRVKIQRDLDTERAFRTMGDDR